MEQYAWAGSQHSCKCLSSMTGSPAFRFSKDGRVVAGACNRRGGYADTATLNVDFAASFPCCCPHGESETVILKRNAMLSTKAVMPSALPRSNCSIHIVQ